MPYPGFFAPLDRQHLNDELFEHALEDLLEQFDQGEAEPCSRTCGEQPCDECVNEHLNHLVQRAEEDRTEALIDQLQR